MKNIEIEEGKSHLRDAEYDELLKKFLLNMLEEEVFQASERDMRWFDEVVRPYLNKNRKTFDQIIRHNEKIGNKTNYFDTENWEKDWDYLVPTNYICYNTNAFDMGYVAIKHSEQLFRSQGKYLNLADKAEKLCEKMNEFLGEIYSRRKEYKRMLEAKGMGNWMKVKGLTKYEKEFQNTVWKDRVRRFKEDGV